MVAGPAENTLVHARQKAAGVTQGAAPMNAIGAHFGHVVAPSPPPQGTPPVRQKDKDGDYDNNQPHPTSTAAPPASGGGAKVNMLV